MPDHIDRKIISLLRENGRAQWKQIGDAIRMSGPAVASRVQRLEDEGVVTGYTVKVDETRLGNHLCAFITVVMKDYGHTRFQEFLRQRPEVKEAHRISGEPCFILKVVLADQLRLTQLLDEILEYGHYKINISMNQCV
ncbi:HTH-type transcriptional regulator LrpB [Chitiniphilus shinanonensis]|uniref:HTH-type transcriptional regulator LrpB n=1 Tax=Chitiniphilus shinanonensis TaxID=553088 RepID=A0ABQ6BV02_9NEIS|nr:Lrp/AsnC family transcriptional regulator [Chitiniphilus shinanonensis]GLS05571.1 HTH-type transcriptional regulator LrpB [Chitiniphilus shinanonensis]